MTDSDKSVVTYMNSFKKIGQFINVTGYGVFFDVGPCVVYFSKVQKDLLFKIKKRVTSSH